MRIFGKNLLQIWLTYENNSIPLSPADRYRLADLVGLKSTCFYIDPGSYDSLHLQLVNVQLPNDNIVRFLTSFVAHLYSLCLQLLQFFFPIYVLISHWWRVRGAISNDNQCFRCIWRPAKPIRFSEYPFIALKWLNLVYVFYYSKLVLKYAYFAWCNFFSHNQ